jgi:transposase
LRPDVAFKRVYFASKIRHVPYERLVFLDESGLNLAMSRSHAWVKKGTEFIDRVPMNWGKNLTMIGAIRSTGWVALTTRYKTVTRARFVSWFSTILLPKLKRGDVVVMDNLAAHKDKGIATMAKLRGIEVRYLPPYSPDFNPIESAWALLKQHVRRCAPRDPIALRRVARRGRHRVKKHHIASWFAHCGYGRNRSN